MSHKALRTAIRASQFVVGRPRLAKFARLLTNEVRLDGANDMEVNGESWVQRLALTAEHPVVFDVGSHFGEWSQQLLAQPGSRPTLFAFEPSAHSAARARSTLGDKAELQQLALSDEVGEASLHVVHEGAGSNSLIRFADPARSTSDIEQVAVSTVDEFCAQRKLGNVTLLKIDAEGHDLAVMRGAQEALSNQGIDLIQFEYNARWIDARAFLLDAFELLTKHGYQLGKVTPNGVETYPRWHPELETFRESNYLAWRQAWASRLKTITWWGP